MNTMILKSFRGKAESKFCALSFKLSVANKIFTGNFSTFETKEITFDTEQNAFIKRAITRKNCGYVPLSLWDSVIVEVEVDSFVFISFSFFRCDKAPL